MRLTRIFLKRPTLVFVFIALTLFAGTLALRSLVVQDMPNTGLRSITVAAAYPGASTTGLVTFAVAPAAGKSITAGFQFDVPVRFDTDQLALTAENHVAYKADIPIVEVRV